MPKNPEIPSIIAQNLSRLGTLYGAYNKCIIAKLIDYWPPSRRVFRGALPKSLISRISGLPVATVETPYQSPQRITNAAGPTDERLVRNTLEGEEKKEIQQSITVTAVSQKQGRLKRQKIKP